MEDAWQPPTTRYFRELYVDRPTLYVQGEGRWSSYAPGGSVQEWAGAIPDAVRSRAYEIYEDTDGGFIRQRLAEGSASLAAGPGGAAPTVLKRDRFLGGASLALAAGYLLQAAAYAVLLGSDLHHISTAVVAFCLGFVVVAASFALIGGALVGRLSLRSRRIRLGAYVMIGGTVVRAAAMTLTGFGVASFASIAAVVPFIFIARAFADDIHDQPRRPSLTRNGLLARAGEWLTIFAALSVLSDALTMSDWREAGGLYAARWTLFLLSDLALTACFIVGAKAFRNAARAGHTDGGSHDDGTAHRHLKARDGLLKNAALLCALSGVLYTVALLLARYPDDSYGASSMQAAYYWLITLSSLRFVAAGLLAAFAFLATASRHA